MSARSGRYEWSAAADDAGGAGWPWARATLRLDVDGDAPQQVASGTLTAGVHTAVDWIATLAGDSDGGWTGVVTYKRGAVEHLPQTEIELRADNAGIWLRMGSGEAAPQRHFARAASSFREIDIEVDTVEGVASTLVYDTGTHPVRPAALPTEPLDLAAVFRRAGVDAQVRSGGTVPLEAAGHNATWNDAELHDAMQVYWSRRTDAPQWAVWALFAARHDAGRGQCGVMFDDIGENHRQGMAVFTKSNLERPPPSETDGDAWRARMTFFTLVHELGHTFNLAHSWQKALETPWMPLRDEAEARSFMNYPQRVRGGEAAFFNDFVYRFSDTDLMFLRHAPERFVQMGNADWFDDHGFRLAHTDPDCGLALELRVRPARTEFEFLEPILLELKLCNTGDREQQVPLEPLADTDALTVIVQRDGRPARQWLPFARTCSVDATRALGPGEAVYRSLQVSTGRNGWDLADPGRYTVQVGLRICGTDIVSNPLPLTVAPPGAKREEVLAQDYFSDDVGRVLALGGSRHFERANDVLRAVAERCAKRRVSVHAAVATAMPRTQRFKQLAVDGDRRRLSVLPVDDAAWATMQSALLRRARTAVRTLGHIAFHAHAARCSERLEAAGDASGAARFLTQLHRTLARSGADHAGKAKRARPGPALTRVLKDIWRRIPAELRPKS